MNQEELDLQEEVVEEEVEDNVDGQEPKQEPKPKKVDEQDLDKKFEAAKKNAAEIERKKLLKELGIKDENEFEMAKKAVEDNKTTTERNRDLEDKVNSKDKKIRELEASLLFAEKGYTPPQIKRLAKLAAAEEDMQAEALSLMEEFKPANVKKTPPPADKKDGISTNKKEEETEEQRADRLYNKSRRR